jgi:hypothetical protein
MRYELNYSVFYLFHQIAEYPQAVPAMHQDNAVPWNNKHERKDLGYAESESYTASMLQC